MAEDPGRREPGEGSVLKHGPCAQWRTAYCAGCLSTVTAGPWSDDWEHVDPSLDAHHRPEPTLRTVYYSERRKGGSRGG